MENMKAGHHEVRRVGAADIDSNRGAWEPPSPSENDQSALVTLTRCHHWRAQSSHLRIMVLAVLAINSIREITCTTMSGLSWLVSQMHPQCCDKGMRGHDAEGYG